MTFEDFYESYPLKRGRGDAEKAWKAAIKIASPDKIMAGLVRYKLNKEDFRQWKQPGPWLRAKMWADEYEEDNQEKKPLLSTQGLIDFRRKYNAALIRRDALPPVPKRTEEQKARAAKLMDDFKRGKKIVAIQR